MSSDKNNTEFTYGFYTNSRTECYKNFGDIFSLPVISGPYELVSSNYIDGNILDIGAGKDTPLYRALKERLHDGRYYSLDTDPYGLFNFGEIDEIPKELKFSVIFANQFFEHLQINDAIALVQKACQHLDDGGSLIATIPNISHPNRYFADITHKTFWNYNSIYMLYMYADLEVTMIARYSKRHPKGFMEKLIAKYVSRIYRMDWCDSILIVGTKSGE